jgi:hypothetical protein
MKTLKFLLVINLVLIVFIYVVSILSYVDVPISKLRIFFAVYGGYLFVPFCITALSSIVFVRFGRKYCAMVVISSVVGILSLWKSIDLIVPF